MFPKGMGNMMKKAQQMQKEMARIQNAKRYESWYTRVLCIFNNQVIMRG